MKIPACLEIGPDGTGAFVPDCPGCWVFGRTPESALRKVTDAVFEWFEWLGRHGEQPYTKAHEIEVVEGEILRVTYNPVEAGKPEPLFWSEILPISREDIRRTIQLMGYSRDDLMKLVSGLDGKVLDWQPPENPRTIRNCLRHIGIVEWWYITRLDIDLPEELPEDVFELLNSTRETALCNLQNLPEEKWRGIYQPRKYIDPEAVFCNLWTARKMLRRFVDHERLHARYVEKVLRMYQNRKQ
jgi:predicted RNase H-like HicB family nuclease